jgi:hypothetical protein
MDGVLTAAHRGPTSNKNHKSKLTFVSSVILENGMLPEPHFPVKPDEFVGRKQQIEEVRQHQAK